MGDKAGHVKSRIKKLNDEDNTSEIDNMLAAIGSNPDRYLTADQRASYEAELAFA